ncbi:MAG: peptidase [Symploca sp. SIO2B6]|nr:peptidase [Symploca sp. SIO2B6]
MLSQDRKRLYRSYKLWSILLLTILIVTVVWKGRSQANIRPHLNQGMAREVSSETQLLSHVSPHPLPESLANWMAPEGTDDYFDQIQATPFGYLVWSRFPITIYLDPNPPSDSPRDTVGQLTPFSLSDEQQQWVETVNTAISEWNQYLPLEQVWSQDNADIVIAASAPPLQWNHPRARTAETTYRLYLDTTTNHQTVLRQRYQILLSPRQTPSYLVATARHELGHALGIWGHSPLGTDALYFSQVRTPQMISARDINTLKKIYQQPTQIGWPVPTPD